VVINTAAWTNVDAAESNRDATYASNALGPKYLAEGCSRCGAIMVQVSTNEVFAGEPGQFYREYDGTSPRSVYARSKLAGESAVQLMSDQLMIVRIAWLYGAGDAGFPAKIRDVADRHGSLRVVDDEFGNPTYAPDAAAAIAMLVDAGRFGIYHLVGHGHASRYEFSCEWLRLSGRSAVPVHPISSSEWQRPSSPPPHAVLINQAGAALGITLRPWQEALAEYAHVEATRPTP
jgi:dTDP-4-dehydrorhamnose reductase